jgi:hypothetical protein
MGTAADSSSCILKQGLSRGREHVGEQACSLSSAAANGSCGQWCWSETRWQQATKGLLSRGQCGLQAAGSHWVMCGIKVPWSCSLCGRQQAEHVQGCSCPSGTQAREHHGSELTGRWQLISRLSQQASGGYSGLNEGSRVPAASCAIFDCRGVTASNCSCYRNPTYR